MKNTNKALKYIFIRHGKLDLPYKNHSEMPISVLTEIASGKINPSIDFDFINERLLKLEPYLRNIDKIVVSSSQRCVETGKTINEFLKQKAKNKINFFIESDITEVSFDVGKIISDLDYTPNLKQLNILVFEAISGINEGAETSQSVFNRVKKVLKKYQADDQVILIVTHSFLLETLEMYINNKHVENFNGSFKELLKSSKVGYLNGFTTDADLNIIDLIKIQ